MRRVLLPDSLPSSRKIQRICGYILSASMIAHITATRLVTAWNTQESDVDQLLEILKKSN